MVNLALREDERAIADIIGSKNEKKIPKKIPLDFIINNRICCLLYKKKGYELWVKRIKQIQDKVEEEKILKNEIYNLSKIFKENGISFIMLCKAIESECDGNEVDVLVEDHQMKKVKNIMKNLEYINAPWGGAYSKMFGKVIFMDIYSKKSNNIIFHGEESKKEINGICTLSPEYELSLRILKPIRIRATRITLCDIIHLSKLLEQYNISRLPKNIRKSWYVPCLHSIYLLNTLYKAIYYKDIRAPIVEKAKEFHKCSRIWRLLSKIETMKVNLPFRSFIFSYSCFIYKLLYHITHFDFKEFIRSILFFIDNIAIPISNNDISIATLRRILKRKRILICFSGMDGTGKTIHATKIVKRFKKMGIPCQYVWCNWIPKISHPFMAFIYLTKGYRRKDYHRSKILRKIWSYLVILDFLYIYLTKVKIPILIGKNVVCDRYVYDMIGDLIYDRLYNARASKILLKLIPRPDLIFMLDVPEEVSNTRKNDTKDSINIKNSDSAIDYLRIHRKSYLKIANSLNIPIIEATKGFEELHSEIYKQVLQAYTSKQR